MSIQSQNDDNTRHSLPREFQRKGCAGYCFRCKFINSDFAYHPCMTGWPLTLGTLDEFF